MHYRQNYCDRQGHTDQFNGCGDSECVLKIHVYYPNNNWDYANCPLPAIILFHGGAYNECGDYNDAGILALSRDLVSRGYVVFNVNYRVGVITDQRPLITSEENQGLAFVSAQQILAITRAVQDARGAIRSIIKMDGDGTFLNTNGSHPYKIDTNHIFVGGVSAGSLIALAACFFGDGTPGNTRFNQVCPGALAAFGGTTPNLATLDPLNVYYASRGEVADFHTHIAGILNCWGSLFIPTANLSSPYDFYKGQNFSLPPVISFCGAKDTVFWYTHQGVYFSPPGSMGAYSLNNEPRCVPQSGGYTVPFDDIGSPTPYEYAIGSQDIYNMLHTPGGTNMPVTTEFYLDCQMYHGLDDDDPTCGTCTTNLANHFLRSDCITLCNYHSNFGVATANTQALTYDYIAARAATFFQTILGNSTANISTTKFVECENKRVKCSGTTNSGCSDDAVCP